VRAVFAVLGSMSVQGPVIHWVSDHRKHHAFTDEEGDPHSPHVGAGRGLRRALAGLWHAHVGWLFSAAGRAEPQRYARDLVADPLMRGISRLFPGWVALGLAIPFAIGYAATGSLRGGLIGLLWGGLVRIFLLHHVTFAINSVCHFFGRRRFATDDESRNVFWLAVPSFGEAWHHNHHRSEEHTSELQSPCNLVCRLLLEKKKKKTTSVINQAYIIATSITTICLNYTFIKFFIHSSNVLNPDDSLFLVLSVVIVYH